MRRSALPTPRSFRASSMFSRAVSHGKRAASWNMKAAPSLGTSRAPDVGSLQSRHDVQQGGLAAAGRTEQGDELALLDGGVDVVQHRGAVAEALAQVFQYDWHGPVLTCVAGGAWRRCACSACRASPCPALLPEVFSLGDGVQRGEVEDAVDVGLLGGAGVHTVLQQFLVRSGERVDGEDDVLQRPVNDVLRAARPCRIP